MGPFIEKLKNAYCWEHDSKQLSLNNAFQNVSRFRDLRGQISVDLFGIIREVL